LTSGGRLSGADGVRQLGAAEARQLACRANSFREGGDRACLGQAGCYPPRPFYLPSRHVPSLRSHRSSHPHWSQVKRRGLAKKDGGVGRRVTGRSKRTFKPNLQPVRVLTPEGSVVTLKLSTKVIKRGIITLKKGDKTVSYPLVKAVRGRNRQFTKAQKG
jgi:ribosomal protein L28